MKIDTKQIVNNLAGKAYQSDEKDLTLGAVIAESLASSGTGGKMKIYILAQKAYTSDSIEVDEADMSLIKRCVEECKSYNNVILGQALAMLEEAK